MTHILPTSLNKAGTKEVREFLSKNNLEWNLDATSSEIEETNSFNDILETERTEIELKDHSSQKLYFFYLTAEMVDTQDMDA